MNSFDELCKKLTQDIGNNIVLKRSWKDDEQFRFNYAVRYLLTILMSHRESYRVITFIRVNCTSNVLTVAV